jgi:DNA invertase Pin-like site-specific DNA recombinase
MSNRKSRHGAYPVKAFLYLRFSSKKQQDGDSIRRQTEWGKAWCQRKKISLDEALTLSDLGVSAFRGKHRKEGGLSIFLDACKRGRVARGSYLIVENLDRLSREHPLHALDLVRELLIDYGIRLVTIHPEKEYLPDMDVGDSMLMTAELARSHSESKAKSVRSKANWQHKRERIGSELLTTKVPRWLEVKDGVIVPNDEKVKTVQLIFDMSRKGFGFHSIAQRLNGDGKKPIVQPIGDARFWHQSYIEKLLKNRAVIGEIQPRAIEKGERVPVGKPIQNYFPVVIRPEIFAAVQQGLAIRRTDRGLVTKKVANLFTHLAFEKGEKMAYHSHNGVGYLRTAQGLSFGARYDQFERVMLYWLREVRLVLDNTDYVDLESHGNDLEKRIKILESRIDSDPDLATLLDKVSQMKKDLTKIHNQMESWTMAPLQNHFLHSQRLIERLADADAAEQETLRRELRQAIRQVVTRIDVAVNGQHKGPKEIRCEVTFRDGKQREIYYRTKAGRIVECGLMVPRGRSKEGAEALRVFTEATKEPGYPVDADPSTELREKCKVMRAEGAMIKDIAAELRLHRVSVYRYLRGQHAD